MNLIYTALLMLLLTSCASVAPDAREQIDQSSRNQQPAKLILFRGQALQGNLAKSYIALEDRYFVALDENQYTQVDLAEGLHRLKARAHGSVASKHAAELNRGQTTCIEVLPNSEDLGLLLVPFLNALVPSFVFLEAPCPSPTQLAQYTEIR